ncbi:hypothetical protein AAA113_03685 [Parabacteroides merdae]
MKYTKEKTGPYHTGFSHFLCHCITDFFLSVDIQIVSLVIYARFLYHCPITDNPVSHPCKSLDYFMQKRV